jgi:hypothetical protein
MMAVGELILQVLPASDTDAGELADLATQLDAELVGVHAVPSPPGPSPGAAKGIGALVSWLTVQFSSLDALRALIAVVRRWTTRTGRTVEVSIDGDVLKVSGISSEQQGEIIEAWLARHGPGT